MRNLLFALAVFIVLLPQSVLADTEDPVNDNDPVYLCQACRDPFGNTVDFGNFAFNALWGKSPWIGTGSGKAKNTFPLRVSNLKHEILSVFVIPSFEFVAYPTDTYTIKIELPNGVVVEYEILASRIGQDLPVGTSTGAGSSAGGGGGESRDIPRGGSGGGFVGGGERGGKNRCGWGIAGNQRNYRCMPR